MARGYYPALVLHTGSARLIMEKESHLGKSTESTGGREGGRGRVEILRLLTVSTASAAFIRSGDWGRDGESFSEQTNAVRRPWKSLVENTPS